MMISRLVAACAVSALLVAGPAAAAPVFTNWTAVDFTGNTASGTMGGVTVSLSAGNIDSATINDSAAIYSFSHYTPALALSDAIEVQGFGPSTPSVNHVTFSHAVTDIVLHIHSLASTLVFTLPGGAPIPVTYVSGSIGAGNVFGNTVDGQLSNSGPADCPTDVCGTVMLSGTFTAFDFTALYPEGRVDGIPIQIGATVAAVPAPSSLALFALGAVMLGARRRPPTR